MNALLGNKKTTVVIGLLILVLGVLVIVITMRTKKPTPSVTVTPTPTYSMFQPHDEPQPGVEYEYIEPDEAKKEIAVGNLVRQLPFNGTYASLSYSVKTNKFTAVTNGANKKKSDDELDAFLRKNSIPDRSWIPDLVIQVK